MTEDWIKNTEAPSFRAVKSSPWYSLCLAVHSKETYDPLHMRMLGCLPVLRIRIHVVLVGWIRIQEGQNIPIKIQKSVEISCFEGPDILFLGLQDSSVA